MLRIHVQLFFLSSSAPGNNGLNDNAAFASIKLFSKKAQALTISAFQARQIKRIQGSNSPLYFSTPAWLLLSSYSGEPLHHLPIKQCRPKSFQELSLPGSFFFLKTGSQRFSLCLIIPDFFSSVSGFMVISPRTQKMITLLFIGALLCGLGEYTAFNALPYTKGKTAPGYSALYAYAANQQLIAAKGEDSPLWGSDKKNGLLLTPFCIWALLANRFLKKLCAFSLPNAFLPKLSDFPGMLPLSLGPPCPAFPAPRVTLLYARQQKNLGTLTTKNLGF